MAVRDPVLERLRNRAEYGQSLSDVIEDLLNAAEGKAKRKRKR